MADMFDYIRWRGDIPFSQVPPTPVDMLIFSTLAYVRLEGVVTERLQLTALFRVAVKTLLALPDAEKRCRNENDLVLLNAAAESERFGNVRLTYYRDVFIPEEDTQFAAVSYLLDDGTACLAFRGTDNTLVGWKEDFNMTFQDSIPAQRLAKEYVQAFLEVHRVPVRLTGHSKGGNLAVYAAAKSRSEIQGQILEVYNFDGPGFTAPMMTDTGYRNVIPKIRTYVPQSSVFGMLLEREEPHRIIRSSQIGLLQHDPYSWEVLGGGFVLEESLTADSRFLDRTFKTWLAGMTSEERNEFFDTVFELLMIENTNRPRDLIRPQNLLAYFKNLKSDESMRKVIAAELANLIQSARAAQNKQDDTQ